jgi:hypothetical protein
MDGDAEALAHRRRPAGGRALRILGALLLDEVEDLVGALVRVLGPPGTREQPREPGGGERRRRGIESLTAHPKGGRDLGDGPLVDPVPTQHLVLHLHAIAAIEKLVASEGLILDGVGARMERAGRAEGRDLGIRGGYGTSSGHRVNHNTSILMGRVKEISAYITVAKTVRPPSPPSDHRTPSRDQDEMAMTHGTKFH